MGRVLDGVRQPAEVREPHVVEFRDVTKTYNPGRPNEFTAIRDVKFVVEDLVDKGEFVCILGPSGCGKSTILRLIAGLRPQHPPTSGEVLVMGQPGDGPGADRGMVFQDYTSFDHRTVLDNVAFGLECQGVPRRERYEHARRWIARVGLDVASRPRQVSARALRRHAAAGGHRPHLDPAPPDHSHGRAVRRTRPDDSHDMQDLLLELWRTTQATVFFVTHSIEEAVFLGDRIYVLSNSPGTILHELTIEPSDRPSKEMQREEKFQETVYYLRDLISQLEESRRAGT